jgi:Xaa-Pro aminopeptidase
MPDPARLIYAASDLDADLYWATRFWAPDPFLYLETGGRTVLLLSDLELDRGRAEATVDAVLPLAALEAKARQRGNGREPGDAVSLLLEDHGVRAVVVPTTFPLGLADQLRARGVSVEAGGHPFYPARLLKTADEVAAIETTQRAVEAAVAEAVDVLRESAIRGDALWWRGQPLTAEALRRVVHVALLERDCVGQGTIVACGDQAVDPHERGRGPLRPHQPIVLDVFPRSQVTRYFADMTRTVVKGHASEALRRQYDAVLAGQLRGLDLVRDGASGAAIHAEVAATMAARGYVTGPAGGRLQGFFHGTGHGVGLDIHEPPRIGPVDHVLRAGQVVTVEPGLYYVGTGGVRIEDMVLVERHGCRNLTRAPKTELLEL